MSGRTLGVLTFIETKDHQLMRLVHHWHAPRWIRLWMLCATRGGDGWLWFCLAAVLIAFGRHDGLVAVGQSTLAAATGIVLFLYLKRLTGRRRPCALEPHCWSSLLPPDQFSFPSGHTITAFAVVVPVAAHFPGMAPGLWFCAASIGISRILLGMHFLSDVLAGGLLGACLGAAALLLLR
jgi:undecaprenyl-diphosphatase